MAEVGLALEAESSTWQAEAWMAAMMKGGARALGGRGRLGGGGDREERALERRGRFGSEGA